MLKPIKQLISEAILELGLPDANDTPILKVWAMEAMGEIGTSRLQFKETGWLLVDDLKVNKPIDMLGAVRVILSEDKKHCHDVYIDERLIECGCHGNCGDGNGDKSDCHISMGETQTYFYFSSNAIHKNACKIIYIGLPCDEDGEPLIDDAAKRAVKQYMNYRITLRDRKRNRNNVPLSEVDYERNQWVLLKNQAAGRINMPQVIEMDSIVRQYYDAGLTVDMFVNRFNGWWVGYGNAHL